MTRDAFLNAIVTSSALGGSTNAPIHLAAIARHMGVDLTLQDWQDYGLAIPLLVNMQPAGEYLSEDFHHAGGVRAVMAELLKHGLIRGNAMTANGRTIGENVADAEILLPEVIKRFDDPIKPGAGFLVMRGNLFDSAIMKISVISPEFRERYLSDPADPDAMEGRAFVFDGPEDYHNRIDDPVLGITDRDILVMRGAGPIGYPGAAEVVNMRPPDYLIKVGVKTLPCIGDGRQSGTSGSPSILNASPEAAAGGNLALLETGDRIRIDLARGRVDMVVTAEEIERRREALVAAGGFRFPASQTPWQHFQRANVGQLETGMVLEDAVGFQRVNETFGIPRDNH